MKKITANLLIILGIIGLILNLLSIWGFVEVELAMMKVGSYGTGLGILLWRFIILAIVYIIGLVLGVKLKRNISVNSQRLEIVCLIVLVIFIISFYFLKLNLEYSLATHNLFKTYNIKTF